MYINIQVNKFSTVLENTFKTTDLPRVKLRVDPINCSNGEISKYQGYVGYILAEDGDNVKVYLECGGECAGSIVTVPSNMIDMEMSLTPLEKLKIYCLKYLVKKQNLTKDDMLTQMIVTSSTPEALEAYLKETGCTAEDLLCCYRATCFA